jgi:hypothetical protein
VGPVIWRNGAFKVHSGTLIVASPYFKAALSDRWRHPATLEGNKIVTLLEFLDPFALQAILFVIHGSGEALHPWITLDTLLGIAVVTDYLKCYEALKILCARMD